jgi:hypothetical protein
MPTGSAANEWGVADVGWRAAEALARPAEGEVTPAGLPRRQPQAQLVPGAADADPAGSATPARSAEAVRGRLASYQRGVQEGREIRHDDGGQEDGGHDDGADERGQQHGADEETQ